MLPPKASSWPIMQVGLESSGSHRNIIFRNSFRLRRSDCPKLAKACPAAISLQGALDQCVPAGPLTLSLISKESQAGTMQQLEGVGYPMPPCTSCIARLQPSQRRGTSAPCQRQGRYLRTGFSSRGTVRLPGVLAPFGTTHTNLRLSDWPAHDLGCHLFGQPVGAIQLRIGFIFFH